MKLGGAVAGLAGVAALGGLVKKLNETTDRLDKVSRQLGISSEALQGFHLAAELSGVELSLLDKGLQQLRDSQGEYITGTKSFRDAFDTLGVAMRDSNGEFVSLDELLARTAQAFQDYPEEASKAKLANDLFGRSGKELLPLLEEGREGLHRWQSALERYGGVISNEGVKNNADFNDTITILSNAFKGKWGDAIIFANEQLKKFTGEVQFAKLPLEEQDAILSKQINTWTKYRNEGKIVSKTIMSVLGVSLKQKLTVEESKQAYQGLIDKYAPLRNAVRGHLKDIEKSTEENSKLIVIQRERSEEIRRQTAFINSQADAQLHLMEENAIYEAEALEVLKANNAEKMAIQNAAREEEMQAARDLATFQEKVHEKMRASMFKDDETYFFSKNKIEEEAFRSTMSTMASMASGVKDEGIELFRFWQAAAIANTWMSTYEAAMKAWAQLGIWGGPAAAAIYILGAAQIAKIAGEKPPGKQAGGDVMAGKTFLVGEQGPEILTMGQTGSIAPNRNSGQGVIINIYDGTGRKINQAMSDLRVEVVERANSFGQFAALESPLYTDAATA